MKPQLICPACVALGRFCLLSITSLVFFQFLLIPCGDCRILYVDNTLPDPCRSGNYSTSSRTCDGSEGDAFNSLQHALDVMKTGDTIVLRGGMYREGHIRIDKLKNGSSWEKGRFNTIRSFDSEWAILDGEDKLPNSQTESKCVLGYASHSKNGEDDLKYWLFERIEIKNGRTEDGNFATGFWGNGGPFQWRNCYVHDNLAETHANNPGGLKGTVWNSCVVTQCYFRDNGAEGPNSSHHNNAHIIIYSDYDCDRIARSGFSDSGHHVMQNEYSYNLFQGKAAVAIKYKNDQYLTGRNPVEGAGYNDQYQTLGDTIHHNIFQGTLSYAIDARQDFIQIYNNIFDQCGSAIIIGEPDTGTIYKAVVYNNTILSPKKYGIQLFHYPYYPFQEKDLHAYIYNNIIDGGGDGWNYSELSAWRPESWLEATFNNLMIDRNLFYRPLKNFRDPNGTIPILIGGIKYSIHAFQQTYPKTELFLNEYDPGNLLYQDNTPSGRYKTRPTYILQKGKMIGGRGAKRDHPYLPGARIPSYIGATNPRDSQWVDTVQGLEKFAYKP